MSLSNLLTRTTLVVTLSAALVGCDAIKKKFGKPAEQTTEAPAAQEAAAPAAPACPSGDAPKVLEGQCGGEWKVSKTDTGVKCEYVWGPEVRCPEGTTSTGPAASCYGTTSKEVTGNMKVSSASDCAKHFGEKPMDGSYNMSCCK